MGNCFKEAFIIIDLKKTLTSSSMKRIDKIQGKNIFECHTFIILHPSNFINYKIHLNKDFHYNFFGDHIY